MDRFKFRGKRVDNGEWVTGDLIQCDELSYINSNEFYVRKRYDFRNDTHWCEGAFAEVDPKTVGQYTGLKDKDGKEIYEGDIVDISCYIEGYRKKSKSDKCVLQLKYCGGVYNLFSLVGNIPYTCISSTYGINPNQIEVIGNIYDNPLDTVIGIDLSSGDDFTSYGGNHGESNDQEES